MQFLVSFVMSLINFAFEILVFLCLLRFILQIYKPPYHHPIILVLINLTDRFIIPTRRLLPNTLKKDYACILISFCILLVKHICFAFIFKKMPTPLFIFISIGLDMIRITLSIYVYALILTAIASWLPLQNNPSSPFTVIKLISQSCLSLLKPIYWKVFDLRIMILIAAGSVLMAICRAYAISY